MAPSSKYTLIALLVAFAIIAPSLLHQSAAVRDGGATKAPAPSSANGEVVLHPTATYEIPDLPLPAIIPCPPAFPKIPFIPCYNETPPAPPPRPMECGPKLVMLMPSCSGFLTNSSISAPGNNCCEAVNRFINVTDSDPNTYDLLCLCHIINGDVNQLLTAPVDHAHALSLLQTCLGIDPNTASGICNDDELREHIPAMDLPKPPTPAPGKKA
ncbi:uncharacterized protein LOC8059772 [Sorghum bicolor]|uniref:Bifunctional inhibitor/plant lipid transfer protein/seed storage helical domain-containing protein n=1 Tax=Sorghum bicolor TaxID=4558 RepID=C5X5S5_SORBI|nr:uncharacterized protein LOC8059772 [Sorghum bicolor]EER96337.1 hypothetical protein SORBI_3002G129500 [Sorghum bicolor]|eukprot:XP_002459816.1 uncharacterized protein LOC8059772 [Sorghum bicolor]